MAKLTTRVVYIVVLSGFALLSGFAEGLRHNSNGIKNKVIHLDDAEIDTVSKCDYDTEDDRAHDFIHDDAHVSAVVKNKKKMVTIDESQKK